MTKQYSIIIINYNTSQITLNCIQSIIKFTNNLEHGELIVLDNGSTDDSVEKISKFKNKNIQLILSKDNLGFARGNNLGAKHAQGSYLFFLNSDTLLIKNDLQSNISYLHNHPTIGLLAPRLLNQDLSIQDSCFQDQSILNALKYLFGNKQAIGKYSPKQQIKVQYVVGAAMLISRNLFTDMGGWNEKYFMYFEDLDFCDKVRSFGKQIIYKPDWQVIHLHGQSGISSKQPSQSYNFLVQSSKTYHGKIKYYLMTGILKLANRLNLN